MSASLFAMSVLPSRVHTSAPLPRVSMHSAVSNGSIEGARIFFGSDQTNNSARRREWRRREWLLLRYDRRREWRRDILREWLRRLRMGEREWRRRRKKGDLRVILICHTSRKKFPRGVGKLRPA